MPRDYYELLGVARDADTDEIKRAFRQLARQYHPDVSNEADAEEKFKEINEAYKVLSDEQQRARYDRFGHQGLNEGMGGFGAGGFNVDDIFDIFNSAFGEQHGAQRRGNRRGQDRRVNVRIEFTDAAFGVEKEVEFQRLESCEQCDGSGAATGSGPTTCSTCNGSGQLRQVQQTFLGSMVRTHSCPNCGGSGKVIAKPCRSCDGSGRKRQRALLNVKIPAGVSEGIQIQVRGEGDAGERGAAPGNLFVTVQVKDHDFFRREDNNILLDIPVNIAQATLGDTIEVDTVDGPYKLSLPPGTQAGKIFRLRGRGFPRLRSDGSHAGRGDQLVTVHVQTPTNLNEEQRTLFEQLAKTFGEDVSPTVNQRGFVNKFMDFLAGDEK